jgi:PKD repeat protein
VFNATESYDPDGIITAYLWDFGDNTNTSGAIVEHAYAAEGNYTVTLTVVDDDGAVNNATLTQIVLHRDVAVLAVTASKNLIGKGFSVILNVTVENQGDYTETLNITVYANTTIIQTQTLLLTSGNTSHVTLPWNTTSFLYGNYTLSVILGFVPGENDTEDNSLIDSWVLVTIPGDADGDRDVDIFDIVLVALLYGVDELDPQFNPNCDLNSNGSIDIFDIVLAAGHYGESW